ncbi:hypothetical protein BGZ61DRAFT_477526 [Ilyonectria robusta]|uniref:uncharacterized protein n=1 Tax=Ilyonectria robusta TaxID=1079257 RepID=UPI001E8E080E|nr:uncharacterized protein BGZ61DRAFT_477526 [Ilyonectria robusta]KAH8699529.1 hypothetical protein BGZ61DRAFT_477526 [Ilyonectria robusta]
MSRVGEPSRTHRNLGGGRPANRGTLGFGVLGSAPSWNTKAKGIHWQGIGIGSSDSDSDSGSSISYGGRVSVNGWSQGVTTRGGAHLFQNRASMDVPILDPWRESVWIRELGVVCDPLAFEGTSGRFGYEKGRRGNVPSRQRRMALERGRTELRGTPYFVPTDAGTAGLGIRRRTKSVGLEKFWVGVTRGDEWAMMRES